MTIFGKHIFHSWIPIYQIAQECFLGQRIEKKIESKYRYCVECNKYQEFFYDSAGGFYKDLEEEKVEILKTKIIERDNELFLDFKDLSRCPPEDWSPPAARKK